MRALVPGLWAKHNSGPPTAACRDKARIGDKCQESQEFLSEEAENHICDWVEADFEANIHTTTLGGDLGHDESSSHLGVLVPGRLHLEPISVGKNLSSFKSGGCRNAKHRKRRTEPGRPHPITEGGARRHTRSFNVGSRTVRMPLGRPASA